MKSFFFGVWGQGAFDNGVGRMVGPEGAGEVLGAEELVVDREDLGFSMKARFGGIGYRHIDR